MTSYNPYEHREVTSKSASNIEVIIHLVKSSFGIGVLSLPFAINGAGYVMAIIMGIPIVITILYGMQVLIRTMVKISALQEKPYISYEDCIKIAVQEGPANMQKTAVCAKYTVRTLLIAYPLGICSAYVIFMAESLHKLFPISKDETASEYIYETMLIIPVFLINCIPSLHKMVVFSAIGDILTFTCFAALFYYIFGEEPLMSGDHDMIGKDFVKIPMFVGTVLFALEAISVIMSVEERMKKPQAFLGYFGVYNISMFIVILIYTFIGASAYIKYGSNIKEAVNLNFPHHSWISFGFQCLFIIIIYFSYPIQCYPVIAIMWEDNLGLKVESKKKQILYEYLFRFGVTLFTFIVAMILPKFDLMVTLVGATCISTLGLFLPGYLEYLYTWKIQNGRHNLTMIKDLGMMILGITILVTVVTCTIITQIIGLLNQLNRHGKDRSENVRGLYGLNG